MPKHYTKQHKRIQIFEQKERTIVTDRGKLGGRHQYVINPIKLG